AQGDRPHPNSKILPRKSPSAIGASEQMARSNKSRTGGHVYHRSMIIVPHGAPEGYEWFVALVVLVGLCFAVCTFMRNAKPLDALRRERQDLPAPNPIRPGPGPEDRLRDLQRRFHAVSPAIGESAPASDTLFPRTRANELRRYYRSANIAAVA